MDEALDCDERLMRLVEGIVTSRDSVLPDAAVVRMLRPRFMLLRCARLTPAIVRTRSMVGRVHPGSWHGQRLPGHEQIMAEKCHNEQQTKERPWSAPHVLCDAIRHHALPPLGCPARCMPTAYSSNGVTDP
jgi:hypothetical protein